MQSHKNPFVFFDDFILRTPAFSINLYYELGNKKKIQKKELLPIWNHLEFREALFLGSPDFYKVCENYFDDTCKHRSERIEQSLLKYIARMSSRSTPFGLFAGITTGKIIESTAVILNEITNYKRISRLDTSILFALSQWLSKQEVIQNQLCFFPNTSLYKIANHYRYVEYKVTDTERNYSLEGIEGSIYLERILLEASTGKTIDTLSKNLVDDEITLNEARQYIQTLIEHQVLVSELEITLTGEDNLSALIDFLKSLKNTSTYLNPLKEVRQLLFKLDQRIGNDVSDYKSFYDLLDKIEFPFTKQNSIQTDLFVQCSSNTLSKKKAYIVQKALTVLNKLNPSQEHKNLTAFKKAFWHRYETREVPLTTALDIESGIGYEQYQLQKGITPFLDDIILPQSQSKEIEEISTHPVAVFLDQKLWETIHSNHYTMELSDTELYSFSCCWNDLPDTFSALIEIIGEEKNEQLILKSIGGTSAANLHARFGHGSKTIKKHVEQIQDWEKQLHPEKILTEIVHLPEARTGNILKRPMLRKYEIPYLAKSSVPLENQISINDLTLSIRSNRIVLRSKSLNKEVIPRLTNAHNYTRKALPIYHFLCDLQKQQLRTSLTFSWPKKNEKYPFLPRVIYKNCILSKAQWYLKKEDILSFLAVYDDDEKLLFEIGSWRKKYQVPDWVELVEYDNTLPINLKNKSLIRMWLATIKNKHECKLQEFLLTKSHSVKRGQHVFGHEIVLSFYNNTT